jgi:hypothetical protein
MRIVIKNLQLKFDQHRTLIHAASLPNLLGRMFGVKPVPIMFIGHNTTWETYPEYGKVNETLRVQLMQAEKRWSHLKRMAPHLKIADLAQQVNKNLNEI